MAIIIANLAGCSEVSANDETTEFESYTLFAPLQSKDTYLINNEGEVVHTWQSEYNPGNSVYLLENGNLLKSTFLGLKANSTFNAGGAGGGVEEVDWDGNIIWNFKYSTDEYLSHHDIERLPNGNILPEFDTLNT